MDTPPTRQFFYATETHVLSNVFLSFRSRPLAAEAHEKAELLNGLHNSEYIKALQGRPSIFTPERLLQAAMTFEEITEIHTAKQLLLSYLEQMDKFTLSLTRKHIRAVLALNTDQITRRVNTFVLNSINSILK